MFLLVDLRTLLLYFLESRKKKSKIIFYFLLPNLNIICFVEKKIFLRFCLCIFESTNVKSACPNTPMQENYKIF